MIKASDDGSVEITIKILKAPSVGQDIRPIGCDISEGQCVLKSGTYLGSPEVGVLASVGITKILVYRKPIVSLLSTGKMFYIFSITS